MRYALPLFAALLFFTPLASAQDESPAELRREIDRLNERIAELEARVERSQDRIDDLLDENRRLRENLRDGGAESDDNADDEGDPEETAGLPSDPLACPDCMRAALEKSWDEEFAGLDITDEAQSRRYLRDVRRWAGQSRRDFRGEFSWSAKVLSARNEGRSTVATVQVVDAQGRPLGQPAEIEAVGSAARTVLQAAPDATLRLEGAASVDIDVDARVGQQDNEVGPYLTTILEFRATRAQYE